jgi:hypothetical protein
MIRMRSIPPSLRLAAVALLLSCVYLVWSVANALSAPAVEATSSRAPTSVVTLHDIPSPRVAEIQEAVSKDPFSESRTRPATRYRLAGEVDVVPETPRQRQPLRWVGVVLNGDDPSLSSLSVALGNNQNAPVQRMKVGEKIGDYTLKNFDHKSATFTTLTGDLIQITNPRKGIR